MWTNILDRISFWSLYLVVVLLPVFFFPVFSIPIEIGKGFLLVVGVAISIIFYLSARFSDGKIVVAKSYVLLSGLLVALSGIISALFSNSLHVSLFGTMLDISSGLFVLSAFLLMLMCSILFKDTDKAKKVLFGGFISMAVVFIFQIFRLIAPKLLSVGVLIEKNDNLLGSWNSFGIIAGLTLISSVFVLEFFHLSKLRKFFLYGLSILSLFFIVLVNFVSVWIMLGVFMMVVFVYKIAVYSNKEDHNSHFRFPVFSFSVVMISLLFFMSGQFIGDFIPRLVGVTNVEVGPSIGATLEVSKDSLIKDPVFGVGPNKFSSIWSLLKPVSINNTQFWDTQFNIGSGYIPTMALTTGVFGIISWLIFILCLFYFGAKTLLVKNKEDVRWEIPLFFTMSFFLFVGSFFYSANSTIVLLAFAYLGVFVGVNSKNQEHGEKEMPFIGDPRKSFFAILALILLMIITAGTTFKYVEKFASVAYFRAALSAETIENAEISINKAVSLYDNDLYLRTYSQIYLIKLNNLVSKGDSLTDEERTQIRTSFENALASSQRAVEYDKSNYLNYRSLANAYNAVIQLGVEGAGEKAVEALNNALLLNPLNPGLKLAISQVYLLENKLVDAKKYATEALELKANYVDALIFLSQISKKEGNSTEALNYAKQAQEILPNNKDLQDYIASFGSTKIVVPAEEVKTEDTKDTKKKTNQ